MHKVFVSFHHSNDQWYKDHIVEMAHRDAIFHDVSVDTGNIDDSLSD